MVESFGAGGVPEAGGFYDCIEEWKNRGRIIVLTTQVKKEGSDLGVYHVGHWLKWSYSSSFMIKRYQKWNEYIKKLLASRRQIWYIRDSKGATAHKVVSLRLDCDKPTRLPSTR